MLDFNPIEMMVVAVVALLVIGPKDLPKAMRFVGQWLGKARGVLRHVRSGFDTMVREAEIEEMEQKWKDENERIMREHPLIEAKPALVAGIVAPHPDDAPAVIVETPGPAHAPTEPEPRA